MSAPFCSPVSSPGATRTRRAIHGSAGPQRPRWTSGRSPRPSNPPGAKDLAPDRSRACCQVWSTAPPPAEASRRESPTHRRKPRQPWVSEGLPILSTSFFPQNLWIRMWISNRTTRLSTPSNRTSANSIDCAANRQRRNTRARAVGRRTTDVDRKALQHRLILRSAHAP